MKWMTKRSAISNLKSADFFEREKKILNCEKKKNSIFSNSKKGEKKHTMNSFKIRRRSLLSFLTLFCIFNDKAK